MNEYVTGDPKGFHITIRPSFGFEGFYDITIWPSNHGTSIQPPISDLGKAKKIAQFLYDELAEENDLYREEQKEQHQRFEEERAKRMAAMPTPKPATIPKGAPIFKVAICPECNEPFKEEDIGEAVFECGNCGQKGVGEDFRRCGDCHRFASKISDTSCPECEEEVSIEDCTIVEAQLDTAGEIRMMGDES